MDQKLLLHVLGRNLFILAFTIIMTGYFMRDVRQALYIPANMGTLSVGGVQYTPLQMNIDVIQNGSHTLYSVLNYPLIPLILGAVYNLYVAVKIFLQKDDTSKAGAKKEKSKKTV
ncbi:hypothetical protein [Caproiciproducens faecalis]|uniref:Uncharacterized protein n=1 Tax=Caproiciproducens faecalis TaxID=2820301 RepID=A0ABS7DPA7_9FIRM|nr:hypothetical protein [Caproiciproducens faecalis]MBW7573023.1 hypothetical protein [Caproiciproducens faecalis]